MALDTRRSDTVSGETLLSAYDPLPVRIINPGGTSSFLLIGDHAGNLVPERLQSLGLPAVELERHIGWDIGIGDLGPLLADKLDAVFIRQTYSRLVIDCNRDPARADAMPEVSDLTIVPGNIALTPEQRSARVAAIQVPYQTAIGAELARRDAAGMATILVSLHSFTPAMQGVARPWQVGVLHDRGNTTFALALIAAFERAGDLTVGDNEPYSMDTIDYTVPRHAYERDRPYAEIEVRQDLIATAEGCIEWAERLSHALAAAAWGESVLIRRIARLSCPSGFPR
ncbi:N-formylglutamate amidohydrolase [Sphingomonas sp. PB4P5]|uniref:N-formylglutamate amidohydrolase n=1 Tax=Parasphingomonas puruogangriensis TaxID=3096155 RepID=UPI002FC86074